MNSTLWVAVAVVGTLAAIIYFLKLVTKRQAQARNKKMWDHYRSLLAQHNLAPDHVEEFPHRIFGLDTERQHFVFVQHDPAQPYELLDLSEQRECRIMNSGVNVSSTTTGGKTHTEEHVNSISLAFTSRSGVRISVPVYTEALDGIEQRKALQEKAGLWHRRILQAMSSLREAA